MLSSLISLVGKIWFTKEHSRWIKSDTPPEQMLIFKHNQQFYVNQLLLYPIFLFFLFYFFYMDRLPLCTMPSVLFCYKSGK